MLTPSTTLSPPLSPTKNGAAVYVVIRLGAHSFALPLGCVDRALRMAACTPVPEGPDWLIGLLNMSGVLLPVLDLNQRLGYAGQTPTPAHRLLLVHGAGRLFALMVDEVVQVTELTAHPEPLPRPSPATEAHRLGSETILVLDPDRLLPAEHSV